MDVVKLSTIGLNVKSFIILICEAIKTFTKSIFYDINWCF